MRFIFSRRFVLAVLVIAAIIFGFVMLRSKPVPAPVVQPAPRPVHAVIGLSVQGRAIDSYTYGTGTTRLAFVGGVHGGYEWNSVLLAYQFKDYLDANPAAVPSTLSVSVIPNANPDGVFKIIGKEGRFVLADTVGLPVDQSAGRFNANKVDLNRNFDCKWQPTSTWRGSAVSAGTSAFSEPEARAIRDFVLKSKPAAVVFWHSQANAVYASECTAGILPKTREIMSAYSKASGYKAVDTFDAYAVTGDAEGWLASIQIPAITVELSTHEAVEWEKNLAGVKALFASFAAK
jgi:hypothetical protein